MGTATQTLAAIRLRAVNDRRYFGAALFALTLIDRPGHGTMSVDRFGRVYVDTTIIGQGKRWTVPEAAGVLVHELGHWLRKHHERARVLLAVESREEIPFLARQLNRAEDAELNDDTPGKGLVLPTDGVTPASLSAEYGVPLDDNRLFEEYWMKIRPEARRRAKQTRESLAELLRGGCGSGAHSVPLPDDLPEPGEAVPGIGEAEGELLRKRVAKDIHEAALRSPSSVPAGWKRWAAKILEAPTVPWERELAALCRNAVTMARGSVDFSYQKPSRRGNFRGILRPALVRPMPEAGIVIDTSGSMDEQALAAALREVQGILRSVGQRRCTVVCADAAAQTVATVSNAFDVDLKGGGGTDMGVGIEALRARRCKVIIVLTDGWTPWPEERPAGCQLVVGIIGEPEDVADALATLPRYTRRAVVIPPSRVLRDGAAA